LGGTCWCFAVQPINSNAAANRIKKRFIAAPPALFDFIVCAKHREYDGQKQQK
jgi:hypothetical protein